MSNLVRIAHQQDVAVITIDNPPVNALSIEVRQGIRAAIEQADNDNSAAAIVLIGAGRTFVAGADIHEFQKITSGSSQRIPELARLVERIEDCRKPVVAAIHGNALGGGMELAVAAHYRVASQGARMGQPEVKLGIIPGAGGTQRLPRLAGMAKAVEMCSLGTWISAVEAMQLGIIDRLIEGDLLAMAIAFAREKVDRQECGTPWHRRRSSGSPSQRAFA